MCAQVRDLIYREILEYHPHMLADYLQNGPRSGPGYMYPSAVRVAEPGAVIVHGVLTLTLFGIQS